MTLATAGRQTSGTLTTLLIAMLAVMATAPRAEAQALSCSFSMPDINFGEIDLTANTTFSTSVTFGVLCSGAPNQRVRVCPHFNAGTGGVASGGNPRSMLSGANALTYNIYRNAAFTNVWGSLFWGQPPPPPTINLRLSAAGTATTTFVVRARVNAGQTTLPAGNYQSSFAGGNTVISYNYRQEGTCAAIDLDNATEVPFDVRALYRGTCTVAATTLDFGTRGVIDAAIDAQSTVTVTCTNGAAYSVGLDGGTSAAVDPTQRGMALGGNTVRYGLYRDAARSLPWGNTIGTNTVAGTGSGIGQPLTGYGRVPAQTTPPPGIYTDTIVVTVTY